MPLKQIDPSWLLTFFKQTAVVTWVVEKNGMVVDVPEWARLTGQSEEEIVGIGWMNAIHPDDRDRVDAAWRTAISHGSLYNIDYRIYCADGIYRWFNVRGAPMLGTDGQILKWVGIVLDIPGHHRFGPSDSASEQKDIHDITPNALRASRAMLNWSVSEMAARSGVSLSTIKRLENPEAGVRSRPANIVRLLAALSDAGLTLLADEGVAYGVKMPIDQRAKSVAAE